MRLTGKIIKGKTKISRAIAHKTLVNIAERLVNNPDGTWALPNHLFIREVELIQCVVSYVVAKPAFEAERLCEDFIATLKSNGLPTKEEISSHKESVGTLVKLYAISAMHNCVVQIADGTVTCLRAEASTSAKRINVHAGVPNMAEKATVWTPMFFAELDPSTHCHPDLLAITDWRHLEIEVGQDKRLCQLR